MIVLLEILGKLKSSVHVDSTVAFFCMHFASLFTASITVNYWCTELTYELDNANISDMKLDIITL